MTTNPKQELAQLLQKKLKKPLPKGSIVYTTEEVDGGHKSTVSLPCDGDKSFAGAKAAEKGEAELNAAKAAVAAYVKEVGAIVPKEKKPPEGDKGQPAKKKAKTEPKAKAAKKAPKVSKDVAQQQTAQCKMTKLNSLVSKVTRKAVAKGELEYETAEVTTDDKTAFQSTITVKTVPGYEGMQFTGIPADSKKDAKQNAAEQALDVLQADASLSEKIAAADNEKKAKVQASNKKKSWDKGSKWGSGGGGGLEGAIQNLSQQEKILLVTALTQQRGGW